MITASLADLVGMRRREANPTTITTIDAISAIVATVPNAADLSPAASGSEGAHSIRVAPSGQTRLHP